MGEVVDFDIGNDSIDAADSREKSDAGNDTFMATPLEYTEDPTQVVLHKEMFVESTSNLRDIRTTQDFFDFQFTDSGRISESKTLTMQNKHPFAIEVNWELLEVMNRTTGQWVKNPFRIRPNNAKVEAGC